MATDKLQEKVSEAARRWQFSTLALAFALAATQFLGFPAELERACTQLLNIAQLQEQGHWNDLSNLANNHFSRVWGDDRDFRETVLPDKIILTSAQEDFPSFAVSGPEQRLVARKRFSPFEDDAEGVRLDETTHSNQFISLKPASVAEFQRMWDTLWSFGEPVFVSGYSKRGYLIEHQVPTRRFPPGAFKEHEIRVLEEFDVSTEHTNRGGGVHVDGLIERLLFNLKRGEWEQDRRFWTEDIRFMQSNTFVSEYLTEMGYEEEKKHHVLVIDDVEASSMRLHPSSEEFTSVVYSLQVPVEVKRWGNTLQELFVSENRSFWQGPRTLGSFEQSYQELNSWITNSQREEPVHDVFVDCERDLESAVRSASIAGIEISSRFVGKVGPLILLVFMLHLQLHLQRLADLAARSDSPPPIAWFVHYPAIVPAIVSYLASIVPAVCVAFVVVVSDIPHWIAISYIVIAMVFLFKQIASVREIRRRRSILLIEKG
ncbi:MAG: hypothetical protein GY906_31720 [bacterium]|nr:hypothetical protein [bacterium]